MRSEVITGDCIDALRAMPDASIDAVVTDPPYGLSQHMADDTAACLWWVRPDGTGRHDDGAVFTVRPAPFRGGARLMGGWQ